MKIHCLILAMLLTVCLHAAPHLPFGEGAMLEADRENLLCFVDGAGAAYRLCDIMGRQLSSGALNGAGELTLKLPQGFYELEFSGHRVGLYVSPAWQGVLDPFWGMQTDVSRRERKEGMAVIEQVLNLLERTGIGTMRDYRSWKDDEPQPGNSGPVPIRHFSKWRPRRCGFCTIWPMLRPGSSGRKISTRRGRRSIRVICFRWNVLCGCFCLTGLRGWSAGRLRMRPPTALIRRM